LQDDARGDSGETRSSARVRILWLCNVERKKSETAGSSAQLSSRHVDSMAGVDTRVFVNTEIDLQFSSYGCRRKI
jgi:hypothetical protein